MSGQRLRRPVGVFQGENHWHKHDNDEEYFYVVEAELHIDLEDRTIDLKCARARPSLRASCTARAPRSAPSS